ncbi:dienelactone hydrolase family protein [Marinitenerispora sediminis]|uniref:Alpha/beta hydrolase n=1 Tax=Marinitenerispora sediminis TaxID=1931232 RepID=A0A368SZ70_9ACTN|nr:alpha/beta family hydrolase [Marinitenerispora sediminis]RCV50192.1 alpha/beta hydrolase [Marinitenerispora sediminis]RCV52271.1 alpha/beta hydrolase [Marinitenerispora sediminis]RCV56899.1 alpha/beta hydrolase [Marinitenerispora sediminis]
MTVLDVRMETAGAWLNGDLTLFPEARGVIVFAHGSGSSRHSPRNRAVAQALNSARFATLLFDLLTADEEVEDRESARLRFDIPLLTERLTGAVSWLAGRDDVRDLPVGLFGASTGAAAALGTAAALPRQVAAVVSRGGRPDLAGPALEQVTAPVLLIVGGADDDVLALNDTATRRMHCVTRLHVVPGATHLFEEPGALAEVADTAAGWFERYLREPGA